MKRHLVTLLVLLLATSLTYAQESKWKHYTNSTTPNCMIEDGNFLWIGTNAGLVKFDRTTNKYQVIHSSTSGLTMNAIMALAKDKDGAIWVGTRGAGVVRFKGGEWTQFNNKDFNFGGGVVWTIACDSTGSMWFGSDGGLARYKDGSFTIFSKSTLPVLVASQIYKVAADRTGGIWVATKTENNTLVNRASILHFDGTDWELHNDSLDTGFPKRDVFSIYPASNGDVWFGHEGKVSRLQGRSWTSYNSTPGAGAYYYVFSLAEDAKGVMYMATPLGISTFNGSSWVVNSRYPLASTKAIVSVGDEMWFAGYEGDGIAKLKDTVWEAFTNLSTSGIGNNHIEAMTIDSRGVRWFAFSDREVVSFDGTTWQTHDFMQATNDMVFALAADSSGNLWLGTSMEGLAKWDGTTLTRFNRRNAPMISNKISAIAYDRQRDAIWFGGRFDQQSDSAFKGAMTFFDGTNWRNFYPGNSGIPWGEINDIDIAPNGDIWIAMPYMGVARYDGVDQWTAWTKSNSDIPDDFSTGLGITKTGVVWLSTAKGAARYQEGKWTAFTSANAGLGAEGLNDVTIDSAGNAWFAGYGAREGALIRHSKGEWTNFGLYNSPVGSMLMTRVMADAHGNIYGGTYDAGVVRYNEQGIKETANVKQRALRASFEVYPNPAANEVNVRLEEGTNQVRITDILGRQRMSMQALDHETMTIGVRDLEPGSYFISVEKDNSVITMPLVISR